MRRIVVWAMSTVTVLVLLFSYSTSRNSTALVAASAETRRPITQPLTPSPRSSAASPAAGGGDPTTADGPSPSPSTPAAPDATPSPAAASAQSFDGDAVSTRYGDVQVQITVAGGKITAAQVLQVPMEDRHDQMINSRAVPVYNGEAVGVQSSQIDVVSGATVTWEGYTQSLQSAIDQAHL